MKEKQGEHPFGDVGQIIALIIFIIVWVLDSFFLRVSTMVAAYIPLYIRLIVALLVLAVSLYLLNASHKLVAGGRGPDRVITDGAFRFSRHPLYLGSVLFYLALTIFTLSIVSFVVWLAIFIFYDFIAGFEEKLLVSRFGEEYLSYRQKSGKWLPKI